MREEAELKNKIASVMGHNFVDAIFEGTTSGTLRVSFLAALDSIARHCEKSGWIDIITARSILEEYNPDKEYNGSVFEIYAKKGLRWAIRKSEERE